MTKFFSQYLRFAETYKEKREWIRFAPRDEEFYKKFLGMWDSWVEDLGVSDFFSGYFSSEIEDKDKITILSFVSAKEAANAYFKLLNSTKFEDIVKNTSLVGSTVKLQLKDNLDENIHNNIDDIVQRIYDKKLHEELLTNILQQLPKEVYTDTVRNFASLHKLGED
jgi:hypothetical protein